MKIGEFARQLGVSTDTLRYYEKHGLLTPSSRSDVGYRFYSENDYKQILSSEQRMLALVWLRLKSYFRLNFIKISTLAMKLKR